MLCPCSFPDSDMYSVGRQDMSLFWGYGKQFFGNLRGVTIVYSGDNDSSGWCV